MILAFILKGNKKDSVALFFHIVTTPLERKKEVGNIFVD